MSHPTVGQAITQLLEQHHLLTAPAMLEMLHAQGQSVNKTSVYRALEKLLEKGQLCKHNLQDNEIAYELRGHHHDHLVCENCAKVTVVDCQVDIPSMQDGYQISHHHLTLYGVCSDCQK